MFRSSYSSSSSDCAALLGLANGDGDRDTLLEGILVLASRSESFPFVSMSDTAGASFVAGEGSGVCRWASVSESSSEILLWRVARVKVLEDPRKEDGGLKKPLDAKGFGRFIAICGYLEP